MGRAGMCGSLANHSALQAAAHSAGERGKPSKLLQAPRTVLLGLALMVGNSGNGSKLVRVPLAHSRPSGPSECMGPNPAPEQTNARSPGQLPSIKMHAPTGTKGTELMFEAAHQPPLACQADVSEHKRSSRLQQQEAFYIRQVDGCTVRASCSSSRGNAGAVITRRRESQVRQRACRSLNMLATASLVYREPSPDYTHRQPALACGLATR